MFGRKINVFEKILHRNPNRMSPFFFNFLTLRDVSPPDLSVRFVDQEQGTLPWNGFEHQFLGLRAVKIGKYAVVGFGAIYVIGFVFKVLAFTKSNFNELKRSLKP